MSERYSCRTNQDYWNGCDLINLIISTFKKSGAFGVLKATPDVAKYTKAKLFNELGKETPMLIRFSNVEGKSGGADAERDVRGFPLSFIPK